MDDSTEEPEARYDAFGSLDVNDPSGPSDSIEEFINMLMKYRESGLYSLFLAAA